MPRNSPLFGRDGAHDQMHVFYDDEDGNANWNGFKGQLSKAGYREKRLPEEDITLFTKSLPSGKVMNIYAVSPARTKDEKDRDVTDEDRAVDHIKSRVQASGGTISMVAHRGHVYYVDETVKHMDKDTKIAFLGTCGGATSGGDVLRNAPSAHVIATPGIGTHHVNGPLLSKITSMIEGQQVINWQKDVQPILNRSGDDRAADYRLPDKNMIMAMNDKLNMLAFGGGGGRAEQSRRVVFRLCRRRQRPGRSCPGTGPGYGSAAGASKPGA